MAIQCGQHFMLNSVVMLVRNGDTNQLLLKKQSEELFFKKPEFLGGKMIWDVAGAEKVGGKCQD